MAIFTALAAGFSAVSSFIGSLGAFGTFALRTAVGVGLSLAAQALAGKQKDTTNFSINGDIQGGGDLARSFILGRYATAGSLVWSNTWGNDGDTPNAWFTQVIALSDLPITGLVEIWVDGKQVTYDPAGNNNTDFGYSIPEYENSGPNLYVKFYNGKQTAADPALYTYAQSIERPWGVDRIGYGVAYAVVHARATKNMFSGFPAVTFVVDGMPLYDPSKDSTVVGGSGPQRFSDPSTWGGDGDRLPAVQIYNIMRGLRYGTRWVYGVQGLTTARLPVQNWITAINKCRQVIVSTSGDGIQYQSGGEISVDQPVNATVENLLTACQGSLSEIGGVYRLFLGEPGTPTISFTDDDILSTDGQTFTPFYGLADTINGISGTYPEPSNGWVMQTARPYLRPDLEAADGGRRLLADVSFDLVPYAEQVQRLMKSALLAALRARRHTIVLPPSFWPYAVPGEVLQWTSARNGYVNKWFVIDGAVDRANLDVMVDITEVDPSDYDWDSETEFHPPVDGAVGPVVPQPQPIIDWFVEPYVLLDNASNSRRPAIRMVWDNSPGGLIGVIGVQWEVRDAATFEVIYRGNTLRADVGSVIIAQNLLPNNAYGVRGQLVPSDPDRLMEWSDWLPVTTPNVLLTDMDIYLPGVVEGVEELVNDATAWIRDGTRQTILEAQRISRLQADEDFGSFLARQQLRTEMVLTNGSITASYLNAITIATGPNSALALRLEELEVYVDTTVASAIDSLQVQIDEQGDALASAITALSAASSAGDVATANFRMTVNAGPSGYAARIGAEARAGGAGAFRAAAWYLDVPSTPSQPTRFLVVAEQFVVANQADLGNVSNPLVFQSGVLSLNVANIGTVNTGILQSPNGKMVITLTAGTIEIYD
ncbi:phage tail protein [Rhizobium grahamii]|uniref:Phage tail fiber protein n=1 Tax=Rhizobium grahamii CCGE 502 TaxID=990285 RepID=S3HNF5_9HYPH|nr:phage tail protein [Rhizobium grahamii]EPE99540.1 phage tail fiber protein [Rhizobium grahamii CCGE 502]